MLLGHAMRRQGAQNANAGLELAQPGHESRAAAAHLADMGQLVELARHDLDIPGHHGVDHQGIGQAMVQVVHGAQGMRAGMHGPQVFLEGDGAHHRAHHHVGTGSQVAGLVYRFGQGARADAQAFERDAITQRVVGRRQVALDVVGEGVHTGGGGHGGGQGQR